MATLLLHVSGKVPLSFIQQLEQNSYDARFNLLMLGGVDTRVVIVDIDEKSLSEQGRWPWGGATSLLIWSISYLSTTKSIP